MYRIFAFIGLIMLPVIFGWWLFVPLAILYVYLAKLPYEIIVAGAILDSVYYFGTGIFAFRLTIISIILIVVAFFLNDKIHWPKRI